MTVLVHQLQEKDKLLAAVKEDAASMKDRCKQLTQVKTFLHLKDILFFKQRLLYFFIDFRKKKGKREREGVGGHRCERETSIVFSHTCLTRFKSETRVCALTGN